MRPPSRDGHRDRDNSQHGGKPVRRAQTFRNSSCDKNAVDMLKFVRDVQFERQNTLSNLNLKAPLPGISHHKFVKHNSFDSGFVDRVAENTDSEEDDSLDLPISLTAREAKPKIDTELVKMLKNPKCVNNNSNDHQVLLKARLNNNLDDLMNNNDVTSRRHGHAIKTDSPRGCFRSNNAKSRTARLPPLERDMYPDRPSAPSPSRTSSDYSDENDSEYADDFEV